ncbi:MAG: metallophosphoesterase [Methylophilaceae bacterium]
MRKASIHNEQIIKGLTNVPAAIRQRLPTQFEDWNVIETHSGHKNNLDIKHFTKTLRAINGGKAWKWPKRRLYIITDPHADAEAFVDSLVLSGGIKKTGKNQTDFKLTNEGKNGTFIIGGDCLDKGPSNLELLKSIRRLIDTGANVKLLAGNHDMRLFMGIHALGLKRKATTAHLFVRMGEKAVPLLLEVHAAYLQGKKLSNKIPNEAECKKRLFPDADWFEQFPNVAHGFMSEVAIKRELQRMRKKIDVFETDCKKAGLNMRDVYATARKCRHLFLHPKGQFAWFYREMQLAYRKGSFLFIHAGLDDGVIDTISKKSVRYINRQFRQHLEKDLFHFYYGSLANTMRTKYRPADLPLTDDGVKRIHREGLYAVVHGHLNRTQGQRIVLKQGLIHIECDITLDRCSRKKEGLIGHGVGVTIIEPQKQVIGISNDYPFVKVFEPERYL